MKMAATFYVSLVVCMQCLLLEVIICSSELLECYDCNYPNLLMSSLSTYLMLSWVINTPTMTFNLLDVST